MDNIYQDISKRTQGNIYIGVVGPVRTGKSTFIKKFMEQLVIPNIDDEFKKTRAIDELPVSGTGKTIMTTEPKFVPDEAVNISVGDNTSFNVRLIDCVGYVVQGANGYTEDGKDRMVKTPWNDEDISFVRAAEIGTEKVIKDHSTVGLVITTDGSFTDISRDDYIIPEQRVIDELKLINKPFAIVVNSADPKGERAQLLKEELKNKYNVTTVCINCEKLSKEDINEILESILKEFPIDEIEIIFDRWLSNLEPDHWLYRYISDLVKKSISNAEKIKDVEECISKLSEDENTENCYISEVDMGKGSIKINVTLLESLFYKILGETSGLEIKNQESLIKLIKELSDVKREYDKVSYALQEVNRKGYGIVSPTIDELKLEEPEIVKQGGKFGVRLKASAPSIHLIKADIETEVSPIVGTEKQSEELVHYLLNEFETDPKKIWDSNIFGKSLHELVNEGLHNKLSHMPDDAQIKLQETLQKIINEGSGGLICIIL